MRILKYTLASLMALTYTSSYAQENYKDIINKTELKEYKDKYIPTQYITSEAKASFAKTPKNVIFFIGDGMGQAQVYAALTANGGQMYMSQLNLSGYSQTQSWDNYVTDSAAGGTALATGKKTRNYMIGMTPDTVAVPSMLHLAEKAGLATGVVVTVAVTHATPASFVAHVNDRHKYEDIATFYQNSGIDVFIGGGMKHFTKRKDGRNLVKEMTEKEGYRFYEDLESAKNDNDSKLAVLAYPEHMPDVVTDRKFSLAESTKKAIDILSKEDNGFFLMVEGSQIDWGGHHNVINEVVNEVLDMDKAVGEALKFAAENKETLIVITADHETGGLSIINGDYETGAVKANFSTGNQTGIMVPVNAAGPGAEEFNGWYQNTGVFDRIVKLLNINK
ncbi:MAG: alkaline phosphatase [Bacteroidales bacterium]|nr:alkaline phosphatase [Bacteroidales bacterium]